MSIKVLITKTVYEQYQYGYKYRDVGKPTIAMHTVDFATREEAEAFKNKKDKESNTNGSYTDVEILN